MNHGCKTRARRGAAQIDFSYNISLASWRSESWAIYTVCQRPDISSGFTRLCNFFCCDFKLLHSGMYASAPDLMPVPRSISQRSPAQALRNDSQTRFSYSDRHQLRRNLPGLTVQR